MLLSKKIHELAKELKVNSKEVIEVASKLNIDVKNHLSTITDEEAKKITKSMGKVNKEKKEVKKEIVSDEPVIMRRTVIIDEDDKKQEIKKSQGKKSDVGFLEKNRKTDYNIVYRNKQSKPMSVAELFGIPSKKKEEPKAEKKETVKAETKEKEEVKTVKEEIKEQPFEGIEKKEIKTVQDNRNVKEKNSNERRNIQRNNTYNKGGNDYNSSKNNNSGFNRNNNGYNNRNNAFQRNNNNTPKNGNYKNNKKLDEKGIDKKINNIMSVDIAQKENVIEYSNRAIDKQKSNRQFEEQKAKKQNKKKGRNEDISSGKLRSLKKESQLSNVDMLDYYDLSTERGRRSEKKVKPENKVKQKIFKLTEITIPPVISVKVWLLLIKK